MNFCSVYSFLPLLFYMSSPTPLTCLSSDQSDDISHHNLLKKHNFHTSMNQPIESCELDWSSLAVPFLNALQIPLGFCCPVRTQGPYRYLLSPPLLSLTILSCHINTPNPENNLLFSWLQRRPLLSFSLFFLCLPLPSLLPLPRTLLLFSVESELR